MTHDSDQPAGPSSEGASQPNPGPPGYFDPALDTEATLALPPATDPARRGRFRAGRVIGVSIAAVVALAAGAGVYAFQTLASSGIQPEHVLPSTVVAFAKVDFDPAASEKIALFRLAQRLPGLKSEFTNSNDLSDAIVGGALNANANAKSWSYAADVKPWLGSRIAAGEVVDASSPSGLDTIVAIAYTNQTKMAAALTKAQRQGVKLGYVTSKGYVLISDTQAHAAKAAAQAQSATLDSNRTFSSDVDLLPGHQVAEAWADYASIVKAVGHSAAGSGLATAFAANPNAALRVVAGVHATASYLELSGYTMGSGSPAQTPAAGAISQLPANTTGALEVGGLGSLLAKVWSTLPADTKQQYLSVANQAGVNLPSDIGALFGADLTVAFRGLDNPAVGVTTRTSEPARAKAVISSLLGRAGSVAGTIGVTSTANGYVVGNNAAFNAQLAAGNGALGSSPTFRAALPDVAHASMIGYLDLASTVANDPAITAKQRHDWGRLSAVGVVVTPTSSGSSFSVRLTTH